MNTDNPVLHSLRSQQLQALARIIHDLAPQDAEAIRRYCGLAGQLYDTRNLSDKSLEQIDLISGKYFQ